MELKKTITPKPIIMKPQFFTLTLFAAFFALHAQTLYFEDNFDSYVVAMPLTMQNSTDWFTWSGGHGTMEDPIVSHAYSSSTPNSLNIKDVNDIIYKFQNQTTGHYIIEMDFFVPIVSKGGHFNMQHFATPSQPAFYYYFNGYGDCRLTVGNKNYDFIIPINQWYPIKVDVNLDKDTCTLYSNGVEIRSWPFHYQTFSQNGLNQLGCLNLYAGYLGNTEGGGNFYVDNFKVWEVSSANSGVFVIEPEEPIELNVNTTGNKTLKLSNTGGTAVDYEVVCVYTIPEVNHTSTGSKIVTHCSTSGTNNVGVGDELQITFVSGYSPAMLREHIGKTIRQFDFGLFIEDDINAIMSAKLCIWDMGFFGMPSNNAPLYEQTIPVASLVSGINSVVLNVPWLIDGRYLYIGFDLTVLPKSVYGSLDETPVSQCNYLGRLYKSYSVWRVLPDTYTEGGPLNGVWDMKIHVDGTPITPWVDLNHTSGTLQPDAAKDLKITFGADDIDEKCEKKARLFFQSTDFLKAETIIDVTVNFLVNIAETHGSAAIQVYPNPTTGELTIDNGQLTINNVEIFDMMGRKQLSIINCPLLIEINISHLPSGIYFLRIGNEWAKVVKQ